MPTLLNRADLLACLKAHPTSSLDEFAAVLGLLPQSDLDKPKAIFHLDLRFQAPISSEITINKDEQVEAETQAAFLQVVARQRFSEDEIQTDEPAWYRDAKPYQNHDPALTAPVNQIPPAQPELMPWRRLWPFLKLVLGAIVDRQQPDLPKTIDLLAKAKLLRTLPKARHKGWASQAQLIIDYDAKLVPFWNDFNELREKLEQLRGKIGLTIIAFPEGDPGGTYWQDTPAGWAVQENYRPLPAGTPVLIVSDLGCNDSSDQRRLRWRRFGAQLTRAGCPAVAFMPSPPRWWSAELTQWFYMVYWDRAIRPPQRLSRKTAYAPSRNVDRNTQSAECLLHALGTAVRVEPALLRATRYLFPSGVMDVGDEYLAWNHPDVYPTLLAFYFRQAAEYKQHYLDDTRLTPELKQQIAQVQAQYHAHLSPVIAYEEHVAAAGLDGTFDPQTAETFEARIAKTLETPESELGQAAKQWLTRMTARQHASVWRNQGLAVAWVKAQGQTDLTHLILPEGLELQSIAWAFKPTTIVTSHIVQRGEELVFTDAEVSLKYFSRVAELLHSSSVVQIETLTDAGVKQAILHHLDQPVGITQRRSRLSKYGNFSHILIPRIYDFG